MKAKKRNMKHKKEYKKPGILYKGNKRPFVVGVSCQKIYGEADLCQTEIEI
jgi:hypothetical protein